MNPSKLPSLLVHGGAGDISAADGEGADAIAGCVAAARAGYAVLARGGAALDAVVEAVRVLEDDPRLVMEQTPHVLLVAAGAEAFAGRQSVERTAAGALVTPGMRERWQSARNRPATSSGGGTVGCVARDSAGRVAAATSTGGTLLKLPGRVGDSAIIGAGTYADDGAGAVSCTGAGEAFIKAAAALRAVEAMRAGRSPADAGKEALAWTKRHGGSGGLICVSPAGQLGLAFDTPRMAHAWIDTMGAAGHGFRS
jgi:beta-aspartyl-peptidase (threonine type)